MYKRVNKNRLVNIPYLNAIDFILRMYAWSPVMYSNKSISNVMAIYASVIIIKK